MAARSVPAGEYTTSQLNTSKSFKRYAAPLRDFHLFSKLPVEVRILIWRATLKPRIIELEFTQSGGFYTQVPLPVALRVSRESRNAILPSYSICFGNIIHSPQIRFNFALDTLFLNYQMQPEVYHLLASLMKQELASLEYLAISDRINDPEVIEYSVESDVILAISKAVPLMTSLRRLQIVASIMWCFGSTDIESMAPTKFYNEFPDSFTHKCDGFNTWLDDHYSSCHNGPDDDCDHEVPDDKCSCYHNPSIPKEFDIIKAPHVQAVWGWRPH